MGPWRGLSREDIFALPGRTLPRFDSMPPQPADITQLLSAWSAGDASAGERLLPLVYAELHAIASRYMRDEHDAATLQPTVLINEAYLRLVGTDVPWESRRHFMAIAARTMRRVLVDHARARKRGKRGGGRLSVTLDDQVSSTQNDPIDVIAIDDALDELKALDDRKAQAVELHYFAGLEYDEVARMLGVSTPTVTRDLRFARSWLYDRLFGG
jgi:RNA polymerase sigma factor (TIGR02999 family)